MQLERLSKSLLVGLLIAVAGAVWQYFRTPDDSGIELKPLESGEQILSEYRDFNND